MVWVSAPMSAVRPPWASAKAVRGLVVNVGCGDRAMGCCGPQGSRPGRSVAIWAGPGGQCEHRAGVVGEGFADRGTGGGSHRRIALLSPAEASMVRPSASIHDVIAPAEV